MLAILGANSLAEYPGLPVAEVLELELPHLMPMPMPSQSRWPAMPCAFDYGQTRYDWQHYAPLIERKQGAFRNGAPFADMPALLQRLTAMAFENIQMFYERKRLHSSLGYPSPHEIFAGPAGRSTAGKTGSMKPVHRKTKNRGNLRVRIQSAATAFNSLISCRY